VLESLSAVYHNDALARQGNLSSEERLLFHQRESGPIMEELHIWIVRQLDERRVEPNSGLGKAMAYLLRHWKKLTCFLRVPGAPLDNNICYAVSGITDVMPTDRLCRVGVVCRRGLGGISDPGDEATRHNQRLSRKASKGSEGQ
jgi:hypothetical protein